MPPTFPVLEVCWIAQVLSLIHISRLANADPFIRHLSHGYDTQLSSDGGNLGNGSYLPSPGLL